MQWAICPTLTTIKICRCLCCGFNATSLKYRVNYLLGDAAKPPVLTASLLQTDVRGGRLSCPVQVGDRKETTSGLGTYCRCIDRGRKPASNDDRNHSLFPPPLFWGRCYALYLLIQPHKPTHQQQRSMPSLDCWNIENDITSADNSPTHPPVLHNAWN